MKTRVSYIFTALVLGFGPFTNAFAQLGMKASLCNRLWNPQSDKAYFQIGAKRRLSFVKDSDSSKDRHEMLRDVIGLPIVMEWKKDKGCSSTAKL